MVDALPVVPAPLDFNGADTDLLGLSDGAGFFGVTPFGGGAGAGAFAAAVLLTPVAITPFFFFGATTAGAVSSSLWLSSAAAAAPTFWVIWSVLRPPRRVPPGIAI